MVAVVIADAHRIAQCLNAQLQSAVKPKRYAERRKQHWQEQPQPPCIADTAEERYQRTPKRKRPQIDKPLCMQIKRGCDAGDAGKAQQKSEQRPTQEGQPFFTLHPAHLRYGTAMRHELQASSVLR